MLKIIETPPVLGAAVLPPHWAAISSYSVAWAKKVKGIWKVLYLPSNCRTRLSDYWYIVNKDSSYGYTPGLSLKEKLDAESTSLFYTLSAVDKEKTIKEINKNLKSLNKKEKKYGLQLTQVEFVSVSPQNMATFGVVFIGDKEWQSNIWKTTIFSFSTKAALHPNFLRSSFAEEYYQILKPHEEKLLSKIKTEYKEFFTDGGFDAVHVNSGFVTICKGTDNKRMTNLLLKDTND